MGKKVDPEMQRFQDDLLESVRQMKAGRAARVTNVPLTAAADARAKVGVTQTVFAGLLGVSVRTESPRPRQGWIWPAAGLLGGVLALGLVAWLLSRRKRKPVLVQDDEPTTVRRPIPAAATPFEPPVKLSHW